MRAIPFRRGFGIIKVLKSKPRWVEMLKSVREETERAMNFERGFLLGDGDG